MQLKLLYNIKYHSTNSYLSRYVYSYTFDHFLDVGSKEVKELCGTVNSNLLGKNISSISR